MSNKGRILTLKVKVEDPVTAEWIWKAHGFTDQGISVTLHGLQVLAIANGDAIAEREAYMCRWDEAVDKLNYDDLEAIEKAVPLPKEE